MSRTGGLRGQSRRYQCSIPPSSENSFMQIPSHADRIVTRSQLGPDSATRPFFSSDLPPHCLRNPAGDHEQAMRASSSSRASIQQPCKSPDPRFYWHSSPLGPIVAGPLRTGPSLVKAPAMQHCSSKLSGSGPDHGQLTRLPRTGRCAHRQKLVSIASSIRPTTSLEAISSVALVG